MIVLYTLHLARNELVPRLTKNKVSDYSDGFRSHSIISYLSLHTQVSTTAKTGKHFIELNFWISLYFHCWGRSHRVTHKKISTQKLKLWKSFENYPLKKNFPHLVFVTLSMKIRLDYNSKNDESEHWECFPFFLKMYFIRVLNP